jgi:hypothetical protein
MKLITSVTLALILAAPLAFAKDKKKKDLPAVFSTARFVYVQAEDGDVMKPGLFPEDREAIGDVQDGLRDWKRYAVTINRSDAELVMIVRKGRLAAAQGMGGVGIGTGREIGSSFPGSRNPAGQNNPGGVQDASTEIGARGEVGPTDDMLRVYTVAPDGRLGALLWSREMKDGLDVPGVMLLRSLRQEVDRAYPPQTASQPATNTP